MILQQQKKPADNETNVWHFDVKREEKKGFWQSQLVREMSVGNVNVAYFYDTKTPVVTVALRDLEPSSCKKVTGLVWNMTAGIRWED